MQVSKMEEFRRPHFHLAKHYVSNQVPFQYQWPSPPESDSDWAEITVLMIGYILFTANESEEKVKLEVEEHVKIHEN
jgi:hypothetical protein